MEFRASKNISFEYFLFTKLNSWLNSQFFVDSSITYLSSILYRSNVTNGPMSLSTCRLLAERQMIGRHSTLYRNASWWYFHLSRGREAYEWSHLNSDLAEFRIFYKFKDSYRTPLNQLSSRDSPFSGEDIWWEFLGIAVPPLIDGSTFVLT
jgi:hypothetical protein